MPVHGGGGPITVLSGIVGPSNVLYVDVAGSNTTGTRGDASKPYLTVQAAVNAASTGDQIRIGPGTFTSTAAITRPVGVTRLSFVGSGSGPLGLTASCVTTLISSSSAFPLFDLGVNLGLVSMQFEGLLLAAAAGGTVIRADGSAYAANGFAGNGVSFTNCHITGTAALDLKYTRNWQFTNCIVNGTQSIVSGGTHTFDQCKNGGTCTYNYDGADPLRTTNQLAIVFRGPGLAQPVGALNIVLSGQARFYGDAACTLTSLTGNVLSVSAALRPSIVYNGTVGTIDFQSTAAKMLPDTTANSITLDFTGCMLTGASALFEVAGAAAQQTVNMTGATGSAAAQTIRANAGIALTARGNAFRAPTYVTAGTGTINPGQVILAPVALAGANQAVALGFTSPVTTYVPQVSLDTLVTGAHAENTFTTVGFNLQTAAGGGIARVSVTWP